MPGSNFTVNDLEDLMRSFRQGQVRSDAYLQSVECERVCHLARAQGIRLQKRWNGPHCQCVWLLPDGTQLVAQAAGSEREALYVACRQMERFLSLTRKVNQRGVHV